MSAPNRGAAHAYDRHRDPDHDHHRATTSGLLLAALGVIILNVSPFLNWVKSDEGAPGPRIERTGYQTDSLVPFMGYLAIGMLLAMLYAAARNVHGQHRALTLTAMGLAIAVAVQCTAFAIEPMGALERGESLVAQIGAYVGILGAALWAVGCGLMVKAGEDHHHTVHPMTAREAVGVGPGTRMTDRPPGMGDQGPWPGG